MLGDTETAHKRKCLCDLTQDESGEGPLLGRIERAQRVPRGMASEHVVRREGVKAKAGDTGT